MATGKIFQSIPKPTTKMAMTTKAPKTTVAMPKTKSITTKPALMKNLSPSVTTAGYKSAKTSTPSGTKGYNAKLL